MRVVNMRMRWIAKATVLCTIAVSLAAVGTAGTARANAAATIEVADAARSASTTHHVILLHGLGRSERAMSWIGRRIMNAGYTIHNIGYPSRKKSVEELAAGLASQVEACCNTPGSTLHFVTHSMGGIVLRALLADSRPENLGRVVMLAPPNRGTELVDELEKSEFFRWAAGPAAQQLGTGEASVAVKLGPADFEVGVITGDRSHNPIGSRMIPGKDDGTVGVESAKLEGMADFLIVDENHNRILRSQPVAREVVFFLRNGRFTRSSLTPEERAEYGGIVAGPIE